MSRPDLYLRTGHVLTDEGRIVSTREPEPQRGPLFAIVRSASRCAWAVREDLPGDLAGDLDRLARGEPPPLDLRDPPVSADRYRSLVRGYLEAEREAFVPREFSGPTFTFPENLSLPTNVVVVTDERLLLRNFSGWTPGEVAAGRAPVFAILADEYPVSVCFCARHSDEAAEAGLETAPAFRGRGLAVHVTAAWASTVRSMGLTPLYSTDWANDASRSVARKLGLVMYASTWSLSE